ncbi:hypothetical protein NQ318_014113 [Aromia moschata]|uniref:Uncharacterized protein n=1 Tax=Aromia moschata TaxID=1265417 RepID=A0AAV8XNS4_9CUCU|nr:hypothetical protein NQ318_014113 [Aromia moschata]
MVEKEFKSRLVTVKEVNGDNYSIYHGANSMRSCSLVSAETHPDLPPLNQGTISEIEAQYREMGHVRKVPSKKSRLLVYIQKPNNIADLQERIREEIGKITPQMLHNVRDKTYTDWDAANK